MVTEGQAADRRAFDAAPFRDAVEAFVRCLDRHQVQLQATDEVLQRGLRTCAATAHGLALPPERYLIVIKNVLNRRPDLQAEFRIDSLASARWTRRDRIVSWAIEAYFDSGEGASERKPR